MIIGEPKPIGKDAAKAEARDKLASDLKSSVAEGSSVVKTTLDSGQPMVQESRLQGSLKDRHRGVSSSRNASEVEKLKAEAMSVGVKLSELMAGDFAPSPKFEAPIDSAEDRLKAMGIGKGKARSSEGAALRSFASTVVFMPDGEEPPQFSKEQQLVRSKFYLAFGADNPDSHILKQQEDFLVELVVRSTALGIDVSWKSFDHGYDQPDIYTSQPQVLAGILQELYADSDKDIWRDVKRNFQGQVSGDIPVEHIGWVQEPVQEPGLGHKEITSHSTRMAIIAREYVVGLSDGVGRDASYIRACEIAGVKPDKPWLLSEDRAREFLEHAR